MLPVCAGAITFSGGGALKSRCVFSAWQFALVLPLLALCSAHVRAQGPAPENAPPLFPGGALISYNSIFTTRPFQIVPTNIPVTACPTFAHEGDFYFTWGFFRNFDFTIVAPIITNRFDFRGPGGRSDVGGTGLGDVLMLVKYRFYRKDSERGTTQASVTLGPKLPTGRTDLIDSSGGLLPISLQSGSGSTDGFLGADFTYTGLFNIRRLVADEDFRSLLRTEGKQSTELGDDAASRFWLSYRPYESKTASREWFIGPALTWLYQGNERILGITQTASGGNMLLAGLATYVGLRPGMHAWVEADWDVAHSAGAAFMPVRHRISFGITQQFRFHL
jgi:hypothetical protein